MKSQLLFLLCNFVLQVSAHPDFSDEEITNHMNWKLLNSAKCGNSNAERIIGGKNAAMGAYPWIVRIGYAIGNNSVSPKNYLYKCGGTLVNELYVITAGHCTANLPTGFKVASIRLGEHNTLTNPDCQDGYCGAPVQDIQPALILVHEHYDQPLFQNDIALIRLSKPAKYNENVFPICLIREKSMLEKTFEDEQAEVAGWGIYDLNILQTSVELRTVKVPIVGIRRCRKIFSRMLDLGSAQLCAGGVVGKDSCAGDSGGPLMKVESLNGPPKYYLIGLVSFGVRRCGEGAKPAVYTRVASYTKWILNNIQP